MEQSLKVTDSIITGCLQHAEALPGTTTSRQQLWLWLETRVKRKCRPARFPPDAPNITSLTAVLFTQSLYLLGFCLSLSFFHSDPWRKKTQLYDGTQWWLMGSAAGDSGQTEIGGFWHLGWVEACSLSPAVSFRPSVFKFCTRHHFSNEHLWTWVNSSVGCEYFLFAIGQKGLLSPGGYHHFIWVDLIRFLWCKEFYQNSYKRELECVFKLFGPGQKWLHRTGWVTVESHAQKAFWSDI